MRAILMVAQPIVQAVPSLHGRHAQHHAVVAYSHEAGHRRAPDVAEPRAHMRVKHVHATSIVAQCSATSEHSAGGVLVRSRVPLAPRAVTASTLHLAVVVKRARIRRRRGHAAMDHAPSTAEQHHSRYGARVINLAVRARSREVAASRLMRKMVGIRARI